ncbi:hypothetical protein EJ02DRAFT_259106 [Clathrospora elynae]|uniref:Uncharacterized protein n=1 Tax=Clathrospora elynae TaxID=706981 RepID=A0A6A5SGW4_9PLEO|nr:hypothetical protein EJ02DRAFT_259106 [Clathrospora elynae]
MRSCQPRPVNTPRIRISLPQAALQSCANPSAWSCILNILEKFSYAAWAQASTRPPFNPTRAKSLVSSHGQLSTDQAALSVDLRMVIFTNRSFCSSSYR